MNEEGRWAGPSTTTTGLFLTAIGVFVVTVAIGILNGLDLVEFDHDTLMTHVHSGTLGWITLAVFVVCGWMFGATAGPEETRGGGSRTWRWLAWLSIVSIPLYVLAFWTGNIGFRALTSLPVFAAIAGLLLWLLAASRAVNLTTPRLAVLAAVATLAVGGFFGTLIQVQLLLVRELVPLARAGGGHVTAMAFGYLVLVGMAIVEWRLGPRAAGLSRAGAAQVAALFVGSLLLTIGAVANIQALLSLNVVFQLIAVAIFVARMARPIAAVPWLATGGARYVAASGVFVVIDILLLAYLIVQFVSGAYGPMDEDISVMAIPAWLIFALDHAIFVGVMTNAIFGLIFAATRDRSTFWPWADHAVFVGTNAGLIGFVVGLAAESGLLTQAFSPIMGASILLGLYVCAVRLLRAWRQNTIGAASA
ncbi:MAG TPA: hypothetical protein VLS28_07745 [Candidatus Sulfomarinibacteraceae bacterium]|nr:hypothetical protein [Candidatus Sulfomarinibacteraceae bacterium]